MAFCFIILCAVPDDGSDVNRNMWHKYCTFYAIDTCVGSDDVFFFFVLVYTLTKRDDSVQVCVKQLFGQILKITQNIYLYQHVKEGVLH
jgi:hypothetical protein